MQPLIPDDAATFSAAPVDRAGRTLYPHAFYGLDGPGKVSVGAPYFNRVTLAASARLRRAGRYTNRPGALLHASGVAGAYGRIYSPPGSWLRSGQFRHEISSNLSPSQQVQYWRAIPFARAFDLRRKSAPHQRKSADHVVAAETHWQLCKPESASPRVVVTDDGSFLGIHWNLLHDWYAVMGENRSGPLRHALCRADWRALIWGGDC